MSEDEVRDKWMKRLCVSSTLIVILSLICVIVGGLSIAESAPTYTFPYCLGGALIAGIMSIISSCCILCVYCEYSGMNRDSVKSWLCWMSVVISFVVISLILGAGLSGGWGMSQTSDRIDWEQRLQRNSYDVTYERTNRSYAIATFVLVLVLSVLHIIAWCQCCKAIETYGFGDSSYHYTYTRRGNYRPQQPLPRNPYVTRENRPRVVPYSIPIPEIYHGTSQQPTDPDQPTVVSSDHRGRASSNDTERQLSHTDSPHTDRPPPSYEELEEGELPSYREVVTEGHYISTGNTEFVTKI